MKLLEEEGVDFARVDYFVEPLSREALESLLDKADLEPRDALRTRDPAYAALDLGSPERTRDELLDALVRHPGLLQRPIVERGSRAVLGRPVERVRALL